jgi:PST family polysaccharide transporter
MTLALTLAGTALFWVLREWIARRLLEDETLAEAIGWLSLGVGFSVAGASQAALLTGLRRIGDVARITVAGALLSGVAGVAVLLWAGERGIVPFVLMPPAAALLAGSFYALRLPKAARTPTRISLLAKQWRMMAGLGFSFMLGGIAVLVGQLAVRVLIQRELGAAALGQFQAAWALSMTYLGFVLHAMGTDYYPRLTSVIGDHKVANRLVNEQTEVALLLGGPVILAMLGAAPWLLHLLYSSAFTEAAAMLRWQILGDLLKIASWPIGFLFLAIGDSRTFIATETSSISLFVLMTWLGIPLVGVEAAGLAFLGLYTFHLPLLYLLAKRKTGFGWSRRVKLLFLSLVAACIGIMAASAISKWAALALAGALSTAAGIYALRQLRDALPKRITALLMRASKLARGR